MAVIIYVPLIITNDRKQYRLNPDFIKCTWSALILLGWLASTEGPVSSKMLLSALPLPSPPPAPEPAMGLETHTATFSLKIAFFYLFMSPFVSFYF